MNAEREAAKAAQYIADREAAVAAQQIYEGHRTAALAVVEAMHHNHAIACDLDGLGQIVAAFRRVALHGDRVSISSAQRVAAEARAQVALPTDEEIAAAADHLLAEMEAAMNGGAAAAAAAELGPELPTPIQEDEPPAMTDAEREAHDAAQKAEALAEALGRRGKAPVESTAPAPALVIKQKPPIAKPGRGRGFAYKGDAS